MVYEMNVGLLIGTNELSPENTWTEIRQRAASIREYLRGQTNASTKFHAGEEPTLVVLFGCKSDLAAKLIATRVAMTWEQDCVALRNGLSGEGWLIGPRAAAWGDYQDDLFVRFEG